MGGRLSTNLVRRAQSEPRAASVLLKRSTCSIGSSTPSGSKLGNAIVSARSPPTEQRNLLIYGIRNCMTSRRHGPARLPHVWLEIKGAKFSTHDLVGKGRF